MAKTAKRSDPVLDAVLHPEAQTRGKHSPLYLWMKRNRAALAAEFSENGPRRAARAEAMAAAGLVDWTGKPPTMRTAQQTWYRVVRDMDRGKRRAAKPKHAPVPPVQAAPVETAVAEVAREESTAPERRVFADPMVVPLADARPEPAPKPGGLFARWTQGGGRDG